MTTTTIQHATTPIYRTWCDRIDSGVFTKSQVRQFAATAGRMAVGMPARGFRTNLTTEEGEMLVDRLIARGGVRLTAEQEEAGIAWLRRYARRELHPPLPDGWLDAFDHFTYNGGFETDYDELASWPHWRVHLTNGRKFDYFAPPHQYGMNRGEIGRWWEVTPDLEAAEREGVPS